jgi:hypothetical protein
MEREVVRTQLPICNSLYTISADMITVSLMWLWPSEVPYFWKCCALQKRPVACLKQFFKGIENIYIYFCFLTVSKGFETLAWTPVHRCELNVSFFFLLTLSVHVTGVMVRRSQWPRGLRHELSSPAGTLWSWVRIPLEIWMSVGVYSLFMLFCV